MQTVEFNERLANILKVLQIERIRKVLEDILFSPTNQQTTVYRSEFAGLVFGTKANLQALATDPLNKEIISSLKLDKAFESDALGQMITGLNTVGHFSEIRGNSNYFRLFCQLHISLGSLESFVQTVQKFLIQPNQTVIKTDETALEFEIVDFDNSGIGMARFEAVLKSIHSLHDSVARATGINGRLAIAYLDSGSNSIVSIKSDHRIIAEIRKLINEVWDKIRFGKYEKLERKLEAAEAGIKFVALVDQREKDGKLDHDTAVKLKHLAISESIELFGKGTSLREIQKETVMDNKILLLEKVDIKLIEAGTANTAEAHQSSESHPPSPTN